MSGPRTLIGPVLRRLRALSPDERRHGFELLGLAGATAVLEWIGGASVFAFVALLSRPDALSSLSGIRSLRPWLGAHPQAARLIALVVVATLHFVRIGSLLTLGRARARLRAEIGRSLSGRLLQSHLRAPDSAHRPRRPAERIRDVTEYAPAVWVAIDSAVYAATEVFVVIGLLSMLAVIHPRDVVISGTVLALFVAGSLRATRRAALAQARQTREVEARSLDTLQQIYRGWREVRMMGREGFFSDRFVAGRVEAVDLYVQTETLTLIPRAVLEAAFVLGACVFAVLSIAGAGGSSDAFPVLGLFAYSGFRAVPAIERMLGYLSTMRWSIGVTEPILGDLERRDVRRVVLALPPLNHGVSLEGVDFTYPGGVTKALCDVNLRVPRGTSLAMVGKTGAGKSTLLDVLLGLLPQERGRVLIDAAPLHADGLVAWRARIGYVPQSPFLLNDSVRRNVAFGLPDEVIDDESVRRALELAQATEFVSRFPGGLNEVVGEGGAGLSGGERQRIAIARALYGQPEVVCLDEATSALDPSTERTLVEALRALPGVTLVMTTHRMALARQCDRVALLSSGRLKGCAPWTELLETSDEFRTLVEDGSLERGRDPTGSPWAAEEPA